MKFFVIYLIVLLMFLNCKELIKQRNIQVIKIDKINITHSPAKKEISYTELIKMDKNNDGIINQFENPTNFSFNNLQEILSAYAEYLNQYQEYDYLYGIYLDKDINKNNKIDDFEKQITELKIKGEKDKCIEILKKKKESEQISKYQFYSAMYSLYNYMGDGQMAEKIGRDMSYKFQLSNFFIFLRLNIPKLHRFWHKYNYSEKDPRYLLSAILSKGLLMFIYTKDDSISRIEKNRNILFPYLFIDKTFMIKFISKIQADLYEKNEQLKIKLESIKNKEKRKSIENDMEENNKSFENLDIIYAHVSKINSLPHYNCDIVNSFTEQLKQYLTDNPDIDTINSYPKALSLIKAFIEKNNIPSSQYHFLVSAVFKIFISNKKPMQETDILFSPEQMFEKGYGVCAEQSLAMSIFINDLLDINESKLYLWFRKAYWNHLSMIYKNIDNKYYILDNSGVNGFYFTSLKKAINYHCRYSYKYIPSEMITKEKRNNTSWNNVETGKNKNITTIDNVYTIIFSEDQYCK